MTDRQAEDAALVERVRSGDRDAYAAFVERYQRLLYRHTRGMGLDHETGLDLVQDAFVKAYARLDECREPGHFRAWLFRICRNLCLDHLKSIRHRSIPLDGLGADPASHRLIPDRALRQSLRDALDALSPDLREAFLLKHDIGYTYKEVAEIIGLTPSAAKMRVHRARHILVDWLSGRENQESAGDDLGLASRLYQ